MTGGDIVAELLRADAAVVAAVPLDRIKQGALKAGFTLPAILIRLVSSVERQPLRLGTRLRVTDRIAVTVIAADYRDQRAIIALVRTTCRGRTGAIAGATGVSVLTAGTGPDMQGPADRFEQTQDFRVSFETTP